jgi:hypothetical protein
MDQNKAVQVAYLVLDLASKSKKYIRELFDPPDNDVEVRSLNCCSRSQSAFLISTRQPPTALIRTVVATEDGRIRNDRGPVRKLHAGGGTGYGGATRGGSRGRRGGRGQRGLNRQCMQRSVFVRMWPGKSLRTTGQPEYGVEAVVG